ncbi:unnamed protein product [Thelazia callipaeda]|uniref:KH domain-containing protein n=1 Tax=Thelazia callipaeda TaxID=103827 RepID=A0A0N5D6D8_THECL|nr:unnamed protein product [Thelazia callipaeda]
MYFRLQFQANHETGDTPDLYHDSDVCSLSDDVISLDEFSMTSDSSDLKTTDFTDDTDEDRLKQNEEVAINYNNSTKKWSCKITIPTILRRFVIGPKESIKRKIETETSCQINFPKKKKKSTAEIVSIVSEESIMRCRDRIQLIMYEARDKAAFTHFISIPMTHEIIKENFTKFIDMIKNDYELSDSCRVESIFQDPKKLHLTITMLSLIDSNEEKLVSSCLAAVIDSRVRKIIDHEPIEAEVSGLEIMNDDPSRAQVLYARISSEKLLHVGNILSEAMNDAGFIPEQESVKLHLTLMNTRYMWEKEKKKGRMDVTQLLEKYGDYKFGKVTISEVSYIYSE